MSYDIYYTIRENKKSRYLADTLFFGKQWFYDYKRIVTKDIGENYFNSYDDARRYINSHNLSYNDVHIRRTLETSGGVSHKDYIYRRYNND